MEDKDYMLEAIEEAKKAKALGDYPFGAVVVCNGEIISRGKAQNNTNGDVTEHAELLAVKEACKSQGNNDLSNCTIYCSSEPCIMCAAAIFQANIHRVVLGTDRIDFIGFLRPKKIRIDELAQDEGFAIEIVKGILKDQVLELFKDIKRRD